MNLSSFLRSRWRSRWRSLFGIVVLSSACGQGAATIADGGGGDLAVTGDDGSAADAGSATFADVLAIFAERCTICHDANKMGLPTYPQLSLTAADAYGALVGQAADETCGGTLVVPGGPASSYLMKKLTQDAPCDGMRMPRPYEIIGAPPLTAAQLATISGWIAAGARP
jgi:cytochrome c5